ncbi:MAG: GNAT family N-acetyltransferase [Planctomycetes bacterium]|nr:GNAT family N-acetyltransferase [Planctomycetota bacterium]
MTRTWTFGELEISDARERLDVDVIHGYLTRSYWAEGIPREVVERSLEHSLGFGAYLGARQVGFARVVTDRATFAWLCDVFVLEEARGRGVSKRLMECVVAHPDLQGLRRFSLATRDAQELYRRYGFEPIGDPTRYLEILKRELYAR